MKKDKDIVENTPGKDIDVTIPAKDEAERLIELAIEKNVSVESLEKLLAMRDKLRAEKAEEAFDRSMANFQRQCPTIKKSVQGYNYKYADLTAIVEQVRDLLSENGFSYTFDTDETEKGLVIYCKIKHVAGHMEQSRTFIDKETTTKMNASQQSGSVMTYGKRYSFCNSLGIMTGDEDTDAANISRPRERSSVVEKSPPTAKGDRYYNQTEETYQNENSDIKLFCENCEKTITDKVSKYSLQKFDKSLCFNCQKLV